MTLNLKKSCNNIAGLKDTLEVLLSAEDKNTVLDKLKQDIISLQEEPPKAPSCKAFDIISRYNPEILNKQFQLIWI